MWNRYCGIFINSNIIVLAVNLVTPTDPRVHCTHSQKKSLTVKICKPHCPAAQTSIVQLTQWSFATPY